MLSRTADHLYWMSRNIERAENIARFLDVANRLSLSGGNARDCWQPALTITGGTEAYQERHGQVVAVSVISWAVLDPANPSSIYSCLRIARENAHAVRSVIPTELWEIINSTWLELKNIDGHRLREQGLTGFCEWIKERSHTVRGATHSTMLRDEAFWFVRLGTFLERSDNTARLLGVRSEGVTADTRVVSASAQLHWAAVLKSVSAYKSYRALTRDDVSPAGVADMLIMNPAMPRSLHTCMDTVSTILERISPTAECTRMAGAAYARLHYGKLSELLANGLDKFVSQFILDNNALGTEIHEDFLMSS
ncbi:alpha-E domain-containing protein [Magnetospirillum aberrantis]|uniref:Alpha-E domain-containing protein n=1 Tax=Magnetospirillum aberrantis SpK TaxID=908842 RepID=A0A7C9QSW6_9PROT|nr:alpha-E domain-containing protein [Magnetospirillum aberrantis]NFV79780.1 alpha-E domain-containing protein [Magnetospirillum aberrantis SpK]